MKSSKLIKIIIPTIITTIFVGGLVYAANNWTAPTANPPAENAPEPIDKSSKEQSKEGTLKLLKNLEIGQNFNDIDTALKVIKGKTELLGGAKVNNKLVVSPGGRICFNNGSNETTDCRGSWATGGGGLNSLPPPHDNASCYWFGPQDAAGNPQPWAALGYSNGGVGICADGYYLAGFAETSRSNHEFVSGRCCKASPPASCAFPDGSVSGEGSTQTYYSESIGAPPASTYTGTFTWYNFYAWTGYIGSDSFCAAKGVPNNGSFCETFFFSSYSKEVTKTVYTCKADSSLGESSSLVTITGNAYYRCGVHCSP